MAYPGSFHRLVLIGNLYGDQFNTTLSIAAASGDMDHVSDTLLVAAAGVVGSWWDDGLTGTQRITAQAKLTGIKLNRIGTDGRYVDATTMEHTYGTPISGGGSAGTFPAPQLATVATLRTAVERGRGSKGRMYLPACGGYWTMQSDGRALITDAQAVADGVSTLITQLNTLYASPPGVATPGRVVIASKVGTGVFRRVNQVTVGRVVDTMRSRRNKLVEDPQSSATF